DSSLVSPKSAESFALHSGQPRRRPGGFHDRKASGMIPGAFRSVINRSLSKYLHRTGSGRPGIFSSWSMQEILPRIAVPGTISPPVLGELSRRLPSDIDVQNSLPVRKGLVGNSRM